jgi:Protein of unknown function (DUF2591)
MKTCELIGPALDWAVATAMGLRVEYDYQYTEETFFQGWWQCGPCHWQPLPKYSSDWAHGGPIIEREKITLVVYWNGLWVAEPEEAYESVGETPLVAAMRCFVKRKLGDEIDIPEELK